VDAHNNTPRDFNQTVVRDEPSPDGIPESSVQTTRMTPFEAVHGTQCQTGGEDEMITVNLALDAFLARRFTTGGVLDIGVVFDEFISSQLEKFDRLLDDNKRLFLDEIYSRLTDKIPPQETPFDTLRQQRTVALWAGLRRVYFAEPEVEDDLIEDGSDSLPTRLLSARNRNSSRARVMNVSDDLFAPSPDFGHPDDSDDAPAGPAGFSFSRLPTTGENFDAP
jgi:hypothetical protein